MIRPWLTAIMLLVGTGASPSAVTVPDITGTWIFVAPVNLRNSTGVGRRIRGFTDTEWYVAQLGLNNDDVWFVYGGHYTLADDIETETVEYATSDFSSFVGNRFTYRVKVEGATLTLTPPAERGEAANGAAAGVWQHGLIRPADRSAAPSRESTLALLDQIELVHQTIAAAPQNLAAAYLGNHNRLDLLAAFKTNDRVALYFGGDQVTAANAGQFRATYQHREDVYRAEMQRRGVPRLAGRYRMEAVQPCDQPGAPRTVTLTQDGVAVDVRDPSDAAYHLSGAATAGIFTLGGGDFNPDTYAYGTISDSGRVELTSFSGAGCKIAMTRLQAP